MKSIGHKELELSKLYKRRANPWAPKYEPELWNDCNQRAYDVTFKRYSPIIDAASKAFGLRIDRPAAVMHLLSKFSDDNLRLVTGREIHEIMVMRKNFMHFLNTTAMSTNCYAYALNVRHGFKPGDLLTPGHLRSPGGECSHPIKSITSLFENLAYDGMRLFDGNPNKDLPPDYHYLVAVLTRHDTDTGEMRDVHFIRYDRDGKCSHKLSHEIACRSNLKGGDIVDPTAPSAFTDYKYQACIVVPSILHHHVPAL